MGLTEAEDIKKRWQEYTELYKEDLNDPDNQDGVITHLEPDVLKCKVKWALGSITKKKASGGGGISAEQFQILKVDGTVLIMPANLENSAVAAGTKRSVFIQIPKKGKAKECSNYHTNALILHASKIMLKIF